MIQILIGSRRGNQSLEHASKNRGWAFIKKKTLKANWKIKMQSEMSKHFTVHFPRTDQSGIYQLMKVGLILWMHLLFDLAPFFEHNHNLRKLYIDARSLEDESAAKLVNILGESRNLRELVLCFNNNGKKWCILNWGYYYYKMVSNLICNNSLKKLSLECIHEHTTTTGWAAFY